MSIFKKLITKILGKKKMNSFIINGKQFNNIQGNNIVINNGRIIVDGKDITDGMDLSTHKNVEITIVGSINNLDVKDCGGVTIKGDIDGNVKASGSVSCTNVGKNVDCGGSFTGFNVTGNVDAGGSVVCGSVGGSIDAGGKVTYTK